jgi:hypothetical protein
MTCPDLLRLTRQILQVAELLPWPVKDRLFQVRLHLSAQETVDTKFSGGDSLEPAHSRIESLYRTISHSRFRAITATLPLYHTAQVYSENTKDRPASYNASLSHCPKLRPQIMFSTTVDSGMFCIKEGPLCLLSSVIPLHSSHYYHIHELLLMQAPQVIPGGPNPRKGRYQEVLAQHRQSTGSHRILVAKKPNEASASQTMIASSHTQSLAIAYSHFVGSSGVYHSWNAPFVSWLYSFVFSGAYLNEPAPPPYLPYPLGLSGAYPNGLATQSLVPLSPHPIGNVLLQWWSLTASQYASTYIPSHMVPRNVANGPQAFNFCPQV